MKKIFFDTETTGLDPKEGHKLIEVALIHMEGEKIISTFHEYIDPKRDIDEGAFRVHGISREQLKGKPEFKSIAAKLVDFVQGATLIAHNAPFDVKFLNAELEESGFPAITDVCHDVLDTLEMAKKLHPGHRNTLDHLCDRYGIDRSQRDLHGALIDTKLLGLMFIQLEKSMNLDKISKLLEIEDTSVFELIVPERKPRILKATTQELETHIETMKKNSPKGSVWDSVQATM